MMLSLDQRRSCMTAPKKIEQAVKLAIPKGEPFRVMWRRLKFNEGGVLQVLTPAWRTLRPYQRALKVQNVLEQHLTSTEQHQIFRISVLTSDEYRRLQRDLPESLRDRNGRLRR